MDARSQALLEFPLVRERLAAATSFPPSRRLAEALEPSADPVIVARRLDETDQARALLSERPGVGVSGAHDIAPWVDRAARGGRLEPQQFLAIGDTLDAAARLQRDPKLRASIHYNLGRGHAKSGNSEAARVALKAAIQEAAGTPMAKEAENALYQLDNLGYGQPAPLFTATARDGSKVSLADFRGKNVVLCRDLTDSYHRDPGAHFEGLDKIIAHIEQHWCPTIISTSITGQPPFRFADDKRDGVHGR